jgi:hypothetical protein
MNTTKCLRTVFTVAPMLAVPIGWGRGNSTERSKNEPAHVKTSDGTAKKMECAPWENCGDDPDPEPGGGTGPCTTRPAHCCDTDASGQCTKWVSACMYCP